MLVRRQGGGGGILSHNSRRESKGKRAADFSSLLNLKKVTTCTGYFVSPDLPIRLYNATHYVPRQSRSVTLYWIWIEPPQTVADRKRRHRRGTVLVSNGQPQR